MFVEILFKMLLFKGGVLIYAEHCRSQFIYIFKMNKCSFTHARNVAVKGEIAIN